jgi:hypothetical protein
MKEEHINKIENRIYNITEGKWFVQDDKIMVFLPELSLDNILIADLSSSNMDACNNLDFILNAKDDIISLIHEVKRLRSLLNLNYVDYNI